MAIQTISNSRAFGWVNACSNDGLALQGILLRASFNSVEGCLPERPASGASTAQQTPVRVADPQQFRLRRTQGESLLVEINGLRQLQLLNGVFVKQLTTALVVILASAGPLFTKLCIQGDEKALRPPDSVLPLPFLNCYQSYDVGSLHAAASHARGDHFPPCTSERFACSPASCDYAMKHQVAQSCAFRPPWPGARPLVGSPLRGGLGVHSEGVKESTHRGPAHCLGREQANPARIPVEPILAVHPSLPCLDSPFLLPGATHLVTKALVTLMLS
jgi:hypothetical protein